MRLALPGARPRTSAGGYDLFRLWGQVDFGLLRACESQLREHYPTYANAIFDALALVPAEDPSKCRAGERIRWGKFFNSLGESLVHARQAARPPVLRPPIGHLPELLLTFGMACSPNNAQGWVAVSSGESFTPDQRLAMECANETTELAFEFREIDGAQRELCYDNAVDLFAIVSERFEPLAPPPLPIAGEGACPFVREEEPVQEGAQRVLVGEGGDDVVFHVNDGFDELRSIVVCVQNMDLNAQPASWKEKARNCGDPESEGYKKWKSLSKTEKSRMMGRQLWLTGVRRTGAGAVWRKRVRGLGTGCCVALWFRARPVPWHTQGRWSLY